MSNFAHYPSLKGRSVMVTGGGSGIGAAIVKAFAAQGAKVAFVDFNDEAGFNTVAETRNAGYEEPYFLNADLRNIDALRAAMEKARSVHGDITVLVNNAARDDRHKFEDVTPEYWDERFALNIRHQFFAAQAVAPMMIRQGGGSIINMGSTSWMIGQGGMPGYTTAKSAVVGLTRSLARDLGVHKIRVNSVAPGWIMTKRQIDLWLDEEGERKIKEAQCLKEKIYPEDIARIVLFFGSDDSKVMTNQTYIADAGWI